MKGAGLLFREKGIDMKSIVEVKQQAPLIWENLPADQKSLFITKCFIAQHHSIDAEQAILGALMVKNDAFSAIPNLEAKHFYIPSHQVMFQEMKTRYAQGIQFNPVLLRNAFDDCFEAESGEEPFNVGAYLVRMCASAVAVINLRDYCDSIIDSWVRRQSFAVMMRCVDGLIKNREGITGKVIVNKIVDELLSVPVPDQNRNITSWDEVTDMVIEDLASKKSATSTGLLRFDDVLKGGLHPRKTYFLQGRMKSGKTFLMLTIFVNVAIALKEKYQAEQAEGLVDYPTYPEHVLYICAEQGQREMHQRVLGRRAGYNSNAFLTMYDDMVFVSDVMEQRGQGGHGLYYDAPGITFAELQNVCMRAVKLKNVKGIFIDHIGLVKQGKSKTRYESKIDFLEDVSEWIHNFAQEHDIWFCIAAQTNREGLTRGGDFAAMNADAVFNIGVTEGEVPQKMWLECSQLRYSAKLGVGSPKRPAFALVNSGCHWQEITEDEETINMRGVTYSALDADKE
jgi:replicative DNA helicase